MTTDIERSKFELIRSYVANHWPEIQRDGIFQRIIREPKETRGDGRYCLVHGSFDCPCVGGDTLDVDAKATVRK